MKSSIFFVLGLMSIILISPSIVSAEESGMGMPTETVGTSDATGVIAPPPMSHPAEIMLRESPSKANNTMAPRDPATGQSTGKRQHEPVIIRKEMDKATPKLLEAVTPRDSASGQSTGNRMMASGTKPMPPEMEKRMEAREHMMGSGTPMNDEKREAMQERMEARREEIAKRIAGQMIARMEAAIARYVKLADRIDSRVTKLKTSGVNTVTAEKDIALARTKIGEAKDAVTLAKSSLTDVVATATDGSSKEAPGKTVRDALAKAREAVVATHKALTDATKSLKADTKLEKSATTSTVTP